MKQKFAQFMYGRYGMDELARVLTFAALVILIISMFFAGVLRTAIFFVALVILVFTYVRMFSRNLEKRRAENRKYLSSKNNISQKFKLRRDMWKQRKNFRFFKCPSCKSVLRVPKGKGKVRIVCKKCGTAFEKKT